MAPGLDQTVIDPVGNFSNVDEELPPTVPAVIAAPTAAVAYLDSDLRREMTAGFDSRSFSPQIRAWNQIAANHRNPAGFRNCSSHQNLDNSQIAGRHNPAVDCRTAALAVPPYLPGTRIAGLPGIEPVVLQIEVCSCSSPGLRNLAGY